MDRKKNISHPLLSPYQFTRSRFYRYTQAVCARVCLPVIFILFFSLTLKAETTYNVGDRSIPIVPHEECERLLTPFLFPEQAIDSGLNKLVELNNLTGAWNNVNVCHDYLKDSYNEISIDKIILASPRSALGKRIMNLQIEQYKNYGTPKAKEIKAEIEKLKEEIGNQSGIFKIFIPQIFNTQKNLTELKNQRKKESCRRNLPSSSNEFKMLKPNSECPDGFESLEEKNDYLAKISSATLKVEEMNKKFMFIQYLSYSADIHDQILDSDTLKDFSKLNCFIPFEETDSMYFPITQMKLGCKQKYIDSQSAADLAEKLALKFGDLSQLILKINELNNKALEEQKRAHKELSDILLNLNKSKSNNETAKAKSIIRLLSRLLGAKATNKQKISLESFCLENEALQWRDKKYFELKSGKFAQDLEINELIAIMEKTGLTEAEVDALRAYTGSFYGIINNAIWGVKPDTPLNDSLAIYKEVADSALDRLPDYYLPVRRFSTLPASVLQEHQVGNIVNYAAYTSTSKEIDWNWSGKHAFTIIGRKNGHDISEISLHRNEKEVLFRSNTNFKVISRKEKPNGGIEFILLEVDDKGMPYNSVSPPGRF